MALWLTPEAYPNGFSELEKALKTSLLPALSNVAQSLPARLRRLHPSGGSAARLKKRLMWHFLHWRLMVDE